MAGWSRRPAFSLRPDPENEDVADIIAPPPSERWIAYPVNRRVNSLKNDDAKLIEPERV